MTFAEAMLSISGVRKYLLLGNGFSIALRPDIFTYGSLYENADFSASPHIPTLFDALGTTDFETVIHSLQNAAKIIEAYRSDLTPLVSDLRSDAEHVKDALVSAVAKRHPDRPYSISKEQYAACRSFLSHFDIIFTLNYDVLLYWSLMQDKVDDLKIDHDDGFRHPEADPSLPYVSWQQGQKATVSYLHGALHLFDRGSEITKYTWSKTDLPIVEQIRDALDGDKFPLFVSEGDSATKLERIMHSAYLHKALRSFEGCCDQTGSAVVIFGHSLADNDAHILKCIEKGKCRHLLVGLYGDPASPANKVIVATAERIVRGRGAKRAKYPLELVFYDTASTKVWG